MPFRMSMWPIVIHSRASRTAFSAAAANAGDADAK